MRTMIVCAAAALMACQHDEPRAGKLTSKNISRLAPGGEIVSARPGDYYLRNNLATFVIQGPGRDLGLGPYGGSLIDVALAGGQDHFGELIPTLALGRTIQIDSMRVVQDGSDGDAVIEAIGQDATNIYYNLEGIDPTILNYATDGGGFLGHDPDAPMNLAVRIRYRLPRDEARLRITYAFENTGPSPIKVPVGFLIDAGGHVETFTPGLGFTTAMEKTVDPSQVTEMLGYDATTDQWLMIHKDVSVGFVPRRIDSHRPRVIPITVPTFGGAMIFDATNVLGAGKEGAFTLFPGSTGELEVDVVVAARAQDVLQRGWELLGDELADVQGCVTLTSGGPASAVRVGLTHAERGSTAVFETDGAGCFSGRVPTGAYTVVAGAMYRRKSEPVALSVPGRVDLVVEDLGQIALAIDIYNALDSQTPSDHPCRLTLLGERLVVSDAALGDAPIDDAGGISHRVFSLRSCRDSVPVAPGRYLASVTRGPEFSRSEQVVEVNAGATTTVSGALKRVVDTTDYAASDFHVHAIFSSDSSVPARARVISLAAEGLDFWASTEHDVVADFQPYIAALGLDAELATVPGAEVTTFDTGHFGAFPLDVQTERASGGTPDWAPNSAGVRPNMDALFDAIHARGALVQVNHPRSGGVALGAYFTRAGLRYDGGGEAYPDPAAMPIAASYLRYDQPYFSDNFDLIEVINGLKTYVYDDMVYDDDAETAGRDWMNYLSAGRRIVAVANSDTHTLAGPPGSPRTLVGGHDGGTGAILAELARGNALLTNGPMLRAVLRDPQGLAASMGDTLAATESAVILHVDIETPDWFRVDRLEVIANAFYPDPSEDTPVQRALPLIELSQTPIARPNGGTALVASIDIPIDLSAEPFADKDAWLVVRAGGTSDTLFPLHPQGGGTLDLAATTADGFLVDRWGAEPYAMTNPIFIDRDGDGWGIE